MLNFLKVDNENVITKSINMIMVSFAAQKMKFSIKGFFQ